MPHSDAYMYTGFYEIKVNDEIVWEKGHTHTLSIELNSITFYIICFA